MKAIVFPFLKLYSLISRNFRETVFEPQLYRLPTSTIFTNFLFQRILRNNGKFPYSLHYTSRVISPEKVKLTKDRTTLTSFAVSSGCYFEAGSGIEIGRNFLFAPAIKLISTNHDPKHHGKDIPSAPIRIGNNVWLGTNVVILPGVEIADGCTVGAGAVVTKSFKEPNTVIVGNPARALEK